MCRVCWRMVCWGAVIIFDSIFVFIYLCIHVSNLLWLLYSSATFDLVVVSIFYLKVVLVTVFICCIHLSISFGLVVFNLFICFNYWIHLSISIGCCVYWTCFGGCIHVFILFFLVAVYKSAWFHIPTRQLFWLLRLSVWLVLVAVLVCFFYLFLYPSVKGF